MCHHHEDLLKRIRITVEDMLHSLLQAVAPKTGVAENHNSDELDGKLGKRP